jgi:uncharacterized protein YjbI with pentapeptide repeats
MGRTTFEESTIEGCDWAGAYIERATWRRARINNTIFSGVYGHDQVFDGAIVERCDFQSADLSKGYRSRNG